MRNYTCFSTKFATLLIVLTLITISACDRRESSNNPSLSSVPTVSPNDTSNESSSNHLQDIVTSLQSGIGDTSKNIKEAVAPHAEQLQNKTKDEVEKLFRWEYRVIKLAPTAPSDQIEKSLVEAGAEGWECFNILARVDDLIISCKRKPRSALNYLKYVPGL